MRILSRITIKDEVVLKNQSFSKIDLNYQDQLREIIEILKTMYEDYWKSFNQINTSIKLPIHIKIKGKDNFKVVDFEKTLMETDLIYDFFISKYDKDFIHYQIIFNGTLDNFLKSMETQDLSFNTQKKIWVLK